MKMFRIGSLILSAAITTMMLGACGEEFRAKQLSSVVGQNNEATPAPQQQQQALTIDQLFASRYENITSSGSELRSFIKAVTVTKRFSQMARGQVQLEADIATNCGERTLVSGMVDTSLLNSGNIIQLSTVNGLSVDLQCTNGNCSQMISVIKFSGAGSTVGIITALTITSSLSSPVQNFQSRATNPVNIANSMMFSSIESYSQGCTPNLSPTTTTQPTVTGQPGVGQQPGASTFELNPIGTGATPLSGTPSEEEVSPFFSL